MNYKVTRRYLKSKEQLIAVFFDSQDALLFLNEQIAQDERTQHKILYRLYDEDGLIHQSSQALLPDSPPEDPEQFNRATCCFRIQTQAENNPSSSSLALFKRKEDALLFVSLKCNQASCSQLNFMLYKDKLLIATLNKKIIENKALREQGTEGTRQGANLSPLSQRPTPPGGPPDYWVDNTDEKES